MKPQVNAKIDWMKMWNKFYLAILISMRTGDTDVRKVEDI